MAIKDETLSFDYTKAFRRTSATETVLINCVFMNTALTNAFLLLLCT